MSVAKNTWLEVTITIQPLRGDHKREGGATNTCTRTKLLLGGIMPSGNPITLFPK